MKLFDLHCDTVTKMYKGQGSFVSNDLGVSLENYSKYDKKAQVFAIWSNSESTDDEAYLEFMHMADFFRELTEENSNEVVLCTDKEQLLRCNRLRTAGLRLYAFYPNKNCNGGHLCCAVYAADLSVYGILQQHSFWR